MISTLVKLKELGFFCYGTGHDGGDTFRHQKLKGLRVRIYSDNIYLESKIKDVLGARWITISHTKRSSPVIFNKLKELLGK